jgi:hypothetical protein
MEENVKKDAKKAKPWVTLRSNSTLIPVITVSILLVGFAVYAFWYVTGQESFYNDRAFRVLSVLDQKLTERLGGIRSLLGAATALSKKKSQEYIADQLLDGYGLTAEEVSPLAVPCKKAYRDGNLSLNLAGDAPSSTLSVEAEYLGKPPDVDACPNQEVKVTVRLRPEPAIRPLFDDLNEGFFDDLLIADESGKVLYQQSTGGDHLVDLNELVRYKPDGTPLVPLVAQTTPSGADNSAQKSATGPLSIIPGLGTKGGAPGNTSPAVPASARTKPFTLVSGFSNVLDVIVAGSAYKLYLQPSNISVREDSVRNTLVLCGLRSANHVREEAHSLPATYVIWGTLALLLSLALGWPFLKISYVSPKQRISLGQFLLLIFTTLLAGSLLTSAALNWTYRSEEDTESRDQLEKLAKNINDQAGMELDRALRELENLSTTTSFNELFPRRDTPDLVSEGNYFKQHRKLYEASAGQRYPWFQFAFWVDSAGLQQLKIAAGTITPRVDVSRDSFFRQIVCIEPKRPVPCDPIDSRLRAPRPPYRFLIYPENSPNTGDFSVLIGNPYQDGDPVPQGRGKDSRLRAQYIVNKFESLVNPVLPPGYGFAVLNRDGKVQFHSIAQRNLIENFFREMQSDGELRERLAQGSAGFLKTNYVGKPQMLYVTPLDAFRLPPLTLVVFRDYEHFIQSAQDANTWFGILALPYIAVLCLLAAAYLLWRSEYPLADLWPEATRQGAYVNVTLTNALLAATYLFSYRSMESFGALFSALGLGAVAVSYPLGEFAREFKLGRFATRFLVLAYLVILAGWGWQLLFAAAYAVYVAKVRNRFSFLPAFLTPGKKQLKYTYTAVATSLLLTIVIVPCLGFFKFAYDVVELDETKHEQVELARNLDHRNNTIHAYLRRIDASYLEDLRKKETLDRHDQAVSRFPSPGALDKDEVMPEGGGFRLWLSDSCKHWLPPNWCEALVQTKTAESGEFSWRWKYLPTKTGDGGASAKYEKALVMSKSQSADPEPVVSAFPSWPGLNAWGKFILIAAVGLLAYWFFRLTRRIFFINWIDPRDLDEMDVAELRAIARRGATYKHILIIGHPKSGKSTVTRASNIGDQIDIAATASTGNWDVHLPRDSKIVILDHFEFGMDTAELNMKKLALLERLVYVEHRHVVILSTVDLMFYLVAGCPEIVWTDPSDSQAAIQVLDRWANLLSLFRKARFKDKSVAEFNTKLGMAQGQPWLSDAARDAAQIVINLVRIECNHTAMLRRIGSSMLDSYLGALDPAVTEEELRKTLAKDVLDRTDSYYRALWATCTKDERLVLFQLSKDGWLNPKNERAIQELQRRNLVIRYKGFRVMNESFRRFILLYQYPEEIAAWEEEVRRSGWHGFRNALALAGLLVGAWLAYTQQQSFHLAIGYVGALGGAVTTVGTLFAALRGRGPKPPAPPGAETA